ncbi:MAG TPA: TIGR02466 family protein [Pseudoduganella sp.]
MISPPAQQKHPSDLSGANLQLLFPSPVMYFDWPDSEALNASLREVVLERRRSSAGTVKTNRGGWQSNTDLQDWPEPAVRQLLERVLELAKEYVARQTGRRDPAFEQGWKIRAWANVNERGHFNRVHDHLGKYSFFSGVYYVNVGDIEEGRAGGGRTRFEDWSLVAIDTNRETDVLRRDVLMSPRNGRMLLFPSSLMHSVERYEGDTQRITLAFNLYHPGFGIPRLDQRLQQESWWWTNFRGLMVLRRKIPEKLYALCLLPKMMAARRVPNPLSPSAWKQHLSLALSHATALASERFEAKSDA